VIFPALTCRPGICDQGEAVRAAAIFSNSKAAPAAPQR
jgi:hypothetical protein